MAIELGLAFEHVPLEWDDPQLRSPEFLVLNPAGSIPTIVDDGFALAESLAINLYLAKTYGRGGPEPLYPEGAQAEAQVWRWSLWAQGHLEPWVQRDGAVLSLREENPQTWAGLLKRGLATLERTLGDRGWLVGETFSVADLNVAGVLSPSRAAGAGLDVHPNAAAWLARCYDRPAAREARRRYA
jgi:glutathione S-transferase